MSELQTYGLWSAKPTDEIKERIQELVKSAAQELRSDIEKASADHVLENVVQSWFPVVESIAVDIAMGNRGANHLDQQSYLRALELLSRQRSLSKDHMVVLNKYARAIVGDKPLRVVPPIVNCVAGQMHQFVLHYLLPTKIDAKAS